MLRSVCVCFRRNKDKIAASMGGAAAANKKKGEAKAEKEKAYHDALLKLYLYKKHADKRSAKEKEAWVQQAKHYAKLSGELDHAHKMDQQRRAEFILESIDNIPEGILRKAAMMKDWDAPPSAMRHVYQADIGPLTEAEIERLGPIIIDQTSLQVDLESIMVDPALVQAEVEKLRSKKSQ